MFLLIAQYIPTSHLLRLEIFCMYYILKTFFNNHEITKFESINQKLNVFVIIQEK